ncbi:manganese-dependent inorganic pyrophosphatase [Candidatus Kaiserbacteria bacterium RIFCSPLOWO2_02_FULL_45_11b]|uniref:inorganic diphosphatase n=1 Tax=Candidatus Kaiserbacteria bacterium RIFCSPLOWO2_12_FULL_45_26 TaxID=1798525 RepID=A0A1F6FFK2_9BACT|nr:MAG: manganese-dependent inorganic pyrophosphatase [Candidatus Kaiserbacteria bacterium RIFCSPLOWO2_01_FULL_45_25]OGG80911.1 MAG: manganese-dependent inorganic pyrophosphatase [Candidatus Kaiserbacteria bacterium RIFCSPLOWO2_02_FULL_45_11b]OGG84649.1 MAG: manganese-dependent inorganic pyrophosphatase [Candidatus Kaiserbacteria bacterium RIFCSPLOWO2_12_FULL_45_26]
MVKVFGHLSPDTDATCSAIVWAWYLNEHTAHEATPFVLGELNSETSFVLNRFGFSVPELLVELAAKDEVIIVDTNNPQELPTNINEANILQIIDHHKLVGGLTTDSPIDITIRPLACTATIQYDLMMQAGVTIPANIAGLMMSAILSDTLGFRSPTTTPHDKDVVEKLAMIAGTDHLAYAEEMFAAKSDVSGFTDSGLIKLDSKKFEVGDKNFRVSVIETTTPATILARQAGIIEAIKACVTEEGDIDDVLFFIVDILNEEATVLTYSDLTKQVISSSFEVEVTTDTEVLPGIVSRKKQIVPALKL